MKKGVEFLLAIMCVLSLTGCGMIVNTEDTQTGGNEISQVIVEENPVSVNLDDVATQSNPDEQYCDHLEQMIEKDFMGEGGIGSADVTVAYDEETGQIIPQTSSQTDVSAPEYVKVDFSGISITGQGPIGVDIVRTNESEVTFEYLNMEHPENCVTNTKVINGIMQITITHSAPDGINVDFGSEPQNVVRVYIPDAVYTQFDITSEQMVLHMQDFNAPVHVTSKQAGFSLIDTNILRGVYDIDVTSGPLYIEADTILKDITANVNNGPIKVCFNENPTNLYLDTINCGPGWVTRPANWSAIYQVGNGTPKVILSNYGPATIEVTGK